MPISAQTKAKRQAAIDRARCRAVAKRQQWQRRRALREKCRTTSPADFKTQAAKRRRRYYDLFLPDVVDSLTESEHLDVCRCLTSRMLERVLGHHFRRRIRIAQQ